MNHSLKPWNTFGIDHNAQHIVCAEDEQQLLNAWQYATAEGQPVLILGSGRLYPLPGTVKTSTPQSRSV